jgi:hypothetical protein
MNLPQLKWGNCLIYAIIFNLKNFRQSLIHVEWKPHRKLPTFYNTYKNLRIGYRSRPKHNNSPLLFKGRPQITRNTK